MGSAENEGSWRRLQPSHKRTAFCVAWEIQRAAQKFGIERLGFFTLTFKGEADDIREAQRRFKSLNDRVFKTRFERAIGVWERSAGDRLHFHAVVVCGEDIQTGFDFQAVKWRDYRSASAYLRREWAFWLETAPKYGFGRHELKPVSSTAEGIARYVGKYVSKHIGQRNEADKGAKTIRFIGFKPGDRTCSSRFAWFTAHSQLWRAKVALFAKRSGARTMGDLKMLFGKNWAYVCAPAIMGMGGEFVL